MAKACNRIIKFILRRIDGDVVALSVQGPVRVMNAREWIKAMIEF